MLHRSKHASVPTFWDCVAAIKIKMSLYLPNTTGKYFQNIGNIFFVLF